MNIVNKERVLHKTSEDKSEFSMLFKLRKIGYMHSNRPKELLNRGEEYFKNYSYSLTNIGILSRTSILS